MLRGRSKNVAAILMALTTLAPVAAAQSPGSSASPAADYRWRNVPILGGGFVSGLVFHPTTPQLLYARTDIGGAYRWDEGAMRWVPLTDHFSAETWNYTGIESIAIDPADPERVYAAVGTYTNNWAGNGAMIRSADRGKTWELTPLPFKNGGNEGGRNSGERLMVDPNDGTRLLFGTRHHGLWESRDRGVSWSQVGSFPVKERTNGVGLSFVLIDGSSGSTGGGSKVIYVAVQHAETPAIYRSLDGGATWAVIENPLAGKLLPQHGKLTADGKQLYVTYGNAAGPNGIGDGALLRLDTASGQWTDISPEKRTPGKNLGYGYSGISLDAKNPQVMVVSTVCRWGPKDEIFRSTDGGKTWRGMIKGSAKVADAGYALKHTPHWTTDVEIDPTDPERVWFVTGYGVWATRNASAVDGGGQVKWSFDNHGLEECVILDLISPPGGDALVISSMYDQDGFRHTSLEKTPPGTHQPYFGGSNALDFAELDPAIVVRQHQHRTVRGSISRDNGVTWQQFAAAPETPSKGTKPNRLAISADGKVIIWGQGDDAPYRSTDGGANWVRVASLPEKAVVVSDRADASRFYASHGESGRMFVSTDGGATFAPGAVVGKDVGRIRAVPGKAGHVYAVVGGKLMRSSDSAVTFAATAGALRVGTFGLGKAAAGSDEPTLFANGVMGGKYGIYRSTDAGRSWVRVNDDGNQFAHLHAIVGDPRVFGRVYLASGSRGIVVGETGEGVR